MLVCMPQKNTDTQAVAWYSAGQLFHLCSRLPFVRVSHGVDGFTARYDSIGNGSCQNGFCHVNVVFPATVSCTLIADRINAGIMP